ncbi:MAG: phage holin family protein [Cypionkella sp.]
MADILGNVGNLVRNEVDLARAEITASVGKAGGAVGIMAVAVLVAITGLNVLAVAMVALVIWAGVPPTWAAAVVGISLLILAYALVQSGKTAFSRIDFMPTRAARNIQRDATTIKEAYNDK